MVQGMGASLVLTTDCIIKSKNDMKAENSSGMSDLLENQDPELYSTLVVYLCRQTAGKIQRSPKDVLDSIRKERFVLQLLEVLTLSCIVGVVSLFLFVIISLIVN